MPPASTRLGRGSPRRAVARDSVGSIPAPVAGGACGTLRVAGQRALRSGAERCSFRRAALGSASAWERQRASPIFARYRTTPAGSVTMARSLLRRPHRLHASTSNPNGRFKSSAHGRAVLARFGGSSFVCGAIAETAGGSGARRFRQRLAGASTPADRTVRQPWRRRAGRRAARAGTAGPSPPQACRL